jgi:hypothetical protein
VNPTISFNVIPIECGLLEAIGEFLKVRDNRFRIVSGQRCLGTTASLRGLISCPRPRAILVASGG